MAERGQLSSFPVEERPSFAPNHQYHSAVGNRERQAVVAAGESERPPGGPRNGRGRDSAGSGYRTVATLGDDYRPRGAERRDHSRDECVEKSRGRGLSDHRSRDLECIHEKMVAVLAERGEVINLDTGEARELVAELIGDLRSRQLDSDLVASTASAVLEYVDVDHVATELADQAGDRTERTGLILQRDLDRIARHTLNARSAM